jgi:hypothetical protein
MRACRDVAMAKSGKFKHFKHAGTLKTPTHKLAIHKPRQSRQAPQAIERLIQFANLPGTYLRPLVPVDTEFPPPPPGDWPRDFSFRVWAGRQDRATLQHWLNQRLKNLPKQFQEYVTGNGQGSTLLWFFSAVGRYEFVRDVQKKLRTIIRAVREAETTRRLPVSLYLETHDAAFIDESWILRKQRDEFDAAFFGGDQKTDARMIRQCEICELFFFARRVDSKVCDPRGKCAATLAKRKERANAKVRAQLTAKTKRAKTARKR